MRYAACLGLRRTTNAMAMDTTPTSLMLLLQLSDSALPIGAFSFSNGLESAVSAGIVHDAHSLEAYARAMALQAVSTDAVAALHARRAALASRYEEIILADELLYASRMNAESRMMLSRMGRKLAELAVMLSPADPLLRRWCEYATSGTVHATFPVTQGIIFAINKLSSYELFCALMYGTVNMILGAALRLLRVSYRDTQCILASLCREMTEYFDYANTLTINDMHSFSPQADLSASLHEKGSMRMFMN